MKKYLLVALVAVFTVSMSFAGAFNPKDVAADAKWMVHVDVAKFQVSELGQYIKSNPDAQQNRNQMAAFREMFNFDPQNDLNSITMYGSDEKHEHAIIVVQGKLDQPKLTTIMKSVPGYTESQHGSHIIATCAVGCSVVADAAVNPVSVGNLPMPSVERGKNVHICFIDAGKVIIGGDIETVKKAVTVCEGQAVSLDAGTVKSATEAGSWVYMMGKGDLASMKKVNPNSQCFSQMESAELVVGEEAGSLRGKAVLTAKTPELAVQMQSVVQGLVALALINAQEEPEMAKLAQAVKATANVNNTEISFAFPVKDLIKIAAQQIKAHVKMISAPATANKDEAAGAGEDAAVSCVIEM